MSKRRGDLTPITAAAVRPRLTDRKNLQRDLGVLYRRPEQIAAWDAFDGVPEVKHAVWGMGNIVAKIRPFVAVMDPEHGDTPVPVSVAFPDAIPNVVASAIAELDRLNRGDGISEILREATMNLDVAGEFYVVGWGEREALYDELSGELVRQAEDERWEVVSISEVSERNGVTFVSTSPSDKGRPLDPTLDTIFRVWQRHPRWSDLADSHLIGCLNDVEQLRALHLRELADNQSRHTGGVFTLPNELTAVRSMPGDDAGSDDDEYDPLVQALDETWSDPIDDPSSVNFGAPTIIRGPAEFLKPDYLRHVPIGRDDPGALDDRIRAKVERLARGLNMPVEFTMGHQATTYANAYQVDEDEFADYVQPRVEFLAGAFTTAFLRPQLLDAYETATDADRELIDSLFVWYDPSAVLPTADLSDKVELGLDRGLIGNPTAREALGFTEDDAPEATDPDGETIDIYAIAETVQKLYLGVDVMLTADEAREILRRYGAPIEGPMPEKPDPEPVAAAATPRTRDDLGLRLVEIDRAFRDRFLAAADAAVKRAIERAGNRLRGQAQLRARLKNVAPEDCAATLGRALVADALPIPGLIDDAFERLERDFRAWAEIAENEAFDIVQETVGKIAGGFTNEQRAALKMRRAGTIDEAWQWTEGALRSLTEAKLFDPSFAIGTIGEALHDTWVPPGLIREAMARAGGGAHVITDGTSAYVTIGNLEPLGGIATGPDVVDILIESGYGVEGWEWSYGPALRARPFEPHRALEGFTFTDFTDPGLAVDGDFPPTGFYTPGDHPGCLCDLIPVIIHPDGATTEDLY